MYRLLFEALKNLTYTFKTDNNIIIMYIYENVKKVRKRKRKNCWMVMIQKHWYCAQKRQVVSKAMYDVNGRGLL